LKSSRKALDRVNRDGSRIDVVIADYHQAMRLAGAAPRGAPGSLADAKFLVLTSDDREADIRRALEAGIQGYLCSAAL
jgi:two-component system NarL family response regulator